MTNTLYAIAKSWSIQESPITPTSDILAWIAQQNQTTKVSVQKNCLSQSEDWFYDREEGSIHNKKHSFFSVIGLETRKQDGEICAQPVLLQQEIGYLGLLCREFDGVMHFLMQAKIEPGNLNKIQLSPTLQATKSNFTQQHGGKQPPYLDYFKNSKRYEIVVDQLQSEQSSRFYKKRNRNIILRVEEDIHVLPNYCWMTLGQVKQLMRKDNMVNMDTRTVLSCIPFSWARLRKWEQEELSKQFLDKPLFHSVFIGGGQDSLPKAFRYINDYKMFQSVEHRLVPLHTLTDWEMRDDAIVCRKPYPYKVIFCDIAIEGREVHRWTQPLLEATEIACFVLVCCEGEDGLEFLVRGVPENGCFDKIELGPSMQRETALPSGETKDAVDLFIEKHLETGEGIVFDHLLSEEGGRFYHEQNRNVLLRVKKTDLPPMPGDCFLLGYRALNQLAQVNNVLNIQLRNLLALLEA